MRPENGLNDNIYEKMTDVMDFSDWRIILAILALIIGFLRLFFPDHFKLIGHRLWSLEKSQPQKTEESDKLAEMPSFDTKREQVKSISFADLKQASEPIIPPDTALIHPDLRIEKITDLMDDINEYMAKNNLKKARKAYEKIEKKLIANDFKEPLAKIQLQIGNLSVEMNDLITARLYYAKSIESAESIGDENTFKKSEHNLNLLKSMDS